MKATPFEFRFRLVIGALLYVLGFWAPWTRYLQGTPPSTTWLELSAALAGSHWLSLSHATIAVTIFALLCAWKGTFLRVWGTAYLGPSTVHAGPMQASRVVASGPYRHMRNPLYWGAFIFSISVAILMPPSGAVFFLVAQAVFFLRLILSEEAYLTALQGEAYLAYKQKVPRLRYRFRPRVASSSSHPQWGISVLAECFYVAFSICFAWLAWRYNASLLTKCLLICFGASLVLRALVPPATQPKAAHD